MKINTSEVLKDLKGKDLKGPENSTITVGEAISNILAYAKLGGKMKMFVLAQKFASQKAVEVDKADSELIKKTIEETEFYTGSLVTGQLLVILSTEK